MFYTRSGEPLNAHNARKVFRKCLKAAKLPKHITPHCLRHTFASLLLQESESAQYAQEQLGHASINLTVDASGKWLAKKPVRGGVNILGALLVANLIAGQQAESLNPSKILVSRPGLEPGTP